MATQPAADALLVAVHADPAPAALKAALIDADQTQLVELAVTHRLAGLVHDTLEPTGLLTASAIDVLGRTRRHAAAQHLVVTRITGALCQLLPEPWAVLKGPAVARHYASPDQRSSCDLDVLVPRSGFTETLDRVELAGFACLNRNWSAFIGHGVAEVPLDGGAFVIDLHWHPIAVRANRASIRLNTDGMLDRRVHFDLGSLRVATLNPVDTVLHLCAHGGLGGARTLVGLVDLDRVIRGHDLNWDEVVAGARSSGMGTMAGMILHRLVRLLDTPIPPEVHRELKPRRGWLAADWLLNAVPRRDKKRVEGWERGLAQSIARDHLADSLAALRLQVGFKVAEKRHKTRPLDWRTDAGGDSAKTAWLQYVESGDL